jgi:5-methylcytosine-specific restriction endonuclease McrA
LLAAVPKEKRIRNRSLLKAMREEIEYCERCGRPGHGGCHHIKYQSQGGDDIKENLIRLCFDCHRGIHDARYNRMELIAIVAGREGMTPEEVAEAIGTVL